MMIGEIGQRALHFQTDSEREKIQGLYRFDLIRHYADKLVENGFAKDWSAKNIVEYAAELVKELEATKEEHENELM